MRNQEVSSACAERAASNAAPQAPSQAGGFTPWVVSGGVPYITCGESGPVFGPVVFSAHCSVEQMMAMARQMAAAPLLLAALKNIVAANAAFRAQLPPDWDGDPVDDACSEARAVIAKALGTEAQRSEPAEDSGEAHKLNAESLPTDTVEHEEGA